MLASATATATPIGSGRFDGAGLLIWQQNEETTTTATAASIPKPTTSFNIPRPVRFW